MLGFETGSSIARCPPTRREKGARLHPVAQPCLIACLLLVGGCDIGSISESTAEPDPEYPVLDGGGEDWTIDDGGGPGNDFADSGSPGDDSGLDGGSDEEETSCLDIGWESYQVDGTCPGLPATGSIEQAACDIAIPGDLGLVIGETGVVDGPLVTTTSCAGDATTSDGPTVELTCLVDSATCTVKLAGGLDNGFD